MSKFIPLPPGTIDLTGGTFQDLKVLEYAGVAHGHAYWWCLCSCIGHPKPKRVKVRGSKLRAKRTTSCGGRRADPVIRKAAWATVSAAKRKTHAQHARASQI